MRQICFYILLKLNWLFLFFLASHYTQNLEAGMRQIYFYIILKLSYLFVFFLANLKLFWRF